MRPARDLPPERGLALALFSDDRHELTVWDQVLHDVASGRDLRAELAEGNRSLVYFRFVLFDDLAKHVRFRVHTDRAAC